GGGGEGGWGGGNREGQEPRAGGGDGGCRRVVKGGVIVPAACLQHLNPLCFERPPYQEGQIEDQIALADALCPARPGIGSAVRGVEDHDVQAGSFGGRRRDGREGRGLDRSPGVLCPPCEPRTAPP